MRIFVIGCGRWGSLIAWYLDRLGHDVTLYGRAGSPRMRRFLSERRNDLLELPPSVALTTDLTDARAAETIVVSIGVQDLRALMEQLRPLALTDRTFVLCMKGLEADTALRRRSWPPRRWMRPTPWPCGSGRGTCRSSTAACPTAW